ncbi:autotransporter outer membrane beta-barrel domain-containing protein [Ochrobactrum sp. SFR4]|uniref:autotransporter family protein n=1 Tax=Ochrobactrum sp. SFR4 TaxID=2717368 RepID=UPI001C8C4910|nr:autotransporter outer membrane beta-barrel domain-containing protein [Ochrobactrum sp. SFR4]MBX8827375.1 autotransporter outer membrane beta-barrel domain-containing protein [Ochrobactrum sp. SFR4]
MNFLADSVRKARLHRILREASAPRLNRGGRMIKWKGATASFAPSSLIIAGAIGTFLIVSNPAAAQTFTGNQTTNGPFSSGEQNFRDTSALNASTANTVSGGYQNFYQTSTLNASAGNAVNGGAQGFYNKSVLNASAANALNSGTQQFRDTSILNASATNAVSGGGSQFFYNTSVLNASSANAISGAYQQFFESSALNASATNAISGGIQNLYEKSMLNASAANAVSGGTQTFNSGGVLNASVSEAVSGGRQIVGQAGMLNASATNAISGGKQRFMFDGVLNASATKAVNNGEQFFSNTSMLNASASNAVSGGQQNFSDTSVLNASATNAISGGTQSFSFRSILKAKATDAVSGGEQYFSGASILNAETANAVSGGEQTFHQNSVLNVLADAALTTNTNIRFENKDGGSGGTVKLNGFSTVVGGINSLSEGSGIVENGGDGDGTLTVDTSVLGNASFSGEARDGGNGQLAIVKAGAGTLLLSGTSVYAGVTDVTGGTLQAGSNTAFSSNSDFTVTDSTLDANGFNSVVASLSNAGLVATNLKGTTTGTTLTVTGDYAGNGGTVILNTVLNGDDSGTDRLLIGGNTAGQSNVRINNVGGTGAPTVEGIRIIEVGGASNGSFTLLGDYVHNGEQAVGDGLYAYKLYKNGVSNPSDGNWYLRSQLKPVDPIDPVDPIKPIDPVDPVKPVTPPLYQPGVSVYESYPQLLLGLNGLPTLQQRVGNRYWNNAGNRIVAEGADAIATPYAPPEEAGAFIEQNGVWGRIEGTHTSIDPRFSTSGAQYDYDLFKLQAGLDGMLHENEAGKLIGGITVHYARGSADIRSPYDADNGGGEIRTDGYGFGGTLTWYGENGFYLDAQGQVTWYDSDLGYDGGNGSLVGGNNGFGYGASLETGKRIALDQNWSLTPQVQLSYSNVDFDSFNDVFGARIGLDRGDSLQGRLGLTLDHQNSWYNDAGMINRTNVYAIANLYYEFLDGTNVGVNGTSFTSRNERLWGGLGLGGSYNWNNDSYSIYGEGSVNTSLTNFADSNSYKGTLGFRVKW